VNENKTIATWRERIGAGKDFPLHAPTDVETAMVAEIAELRGALAAVPVSPMEGLTLNEHTRFILGRPNFTCIRAAHRMRELGHDIEHQAEAEQAAVIYLMLSMYLKHGVNWQTHCNAYLVAQQGHAQAGENGSES
jgi:hypothetical protein